MKYKLFWITALLLVIFTAFAVSTVATTYYLNDGVGGGSAYAGGKCYGTWFNRTSNWNIINVTAYSATNCPYMAIYNQAGTTLFENVTMVGNVGTFGGLITYNASTKYLIAVEGSANCQGDRVAGGNQPVYNYNNSGVTSFNSGWGASCSALSDQTDTWGIDYLWIRDIPSPDYINISQISFANNTAFSSNTIPKNVTINSTYNWNCTAYINNTANGTVTGTAGTNVQVNWTNIIPNGDWNTYITCWQFNSTVQNETTQTYYFHVDSTLPTLTNNITNQILRYQNNNTYKFNFADNLLLWGFNISINGINETTTANIQTAAYQYNGTIYGKNYSVGQQNVTVWFADAHTDESIDEFLIKETDTSIKFDDTLIEVLQPAIVQDILTTKKQDRYSLEFELKTPSKIFQVQIPDDCFYQNRDDLYKGWYVCPKDLKWIDFESNEDYLVDVNAETNIVTVASDVALSSYSFNSIGSLNEVYYNTSFYTFNDSTSVIENVTEQSTEYFNLTITHNGVGNFNISNVVFYWNGTSQVVTQTNASTYTLFTTSVVTPFLNADVNVSYQFNYTINGTSYSTPLTLSHIHHLVLDNCTDYFTPAVTFSFFNISGGSNNVVNATMSGHVATTLYGSFNLTFNSNTTARICLFPNETIAESSQYSFIVPGCGTRNYYLSTDFSNANQNINLYCDSATTQVTFTVYDQYKKLLPNVYIYIQKYDVGTATATTTEIIKTDSNGQAVGNIIKNTQLYKFVLVYLGDIVLETSETYILLDSYSFTLTGSNTYFNNYDHIFGDTSCSLTYTNASTSYSYTFFDSSGNVTQGCLEIYLISNKGETLVNSSCTSPPNLSISLTIPPPLGTNTYEGRGVVYIGTDKFVCSNPVSVTFDLGFKDYGTETLFLSFLMLVFLITVGLWNPAVAVALMCGGIFLLNIVGWFHMSKVWLIGFIIMGGIVMYKMRQS